MAMQYIWLQKKIDQLRPQNITVDIFDTLLLRKWQPEPWRFYTLARLFDKEFKKAKLNTTPYFIYSQRAYLGRTLREQNHQLGFDHETTHSDILTAIITDTARRQGKNLSQKAITTLVQKLRQIELGYEKTQLVLNKKLLELLQTAKEDKKKIYYVSDMYLSTTDLNELLAHFKVKVFAGGISSADTLYGKASGRSFAELARKYPSIMLNQSLYIGDQYQADAKRPKQFGLQTAWLYLPLHRSKLWLGKLVYKVASKWLSLSEKRIIAKQQKLELNKIFSKGSMNTQKEAEYIGWIFAPAIIYYLHQLGLKSSASHKKVVFVTSESITLDKLYQQLGFAGAQKLPLLNRTALIRAYSFVLSQKGLSLSDIVPIVKKILRRKDTGNALLTLGVINNSSHEQHMLGKLMRNKLVLNKIDISDAKKTWQKDYQTILKDWRKLRVPHSSGAILADVGWNDTVQILLTELLSEKKLQTNHIGGLYLGRTGMNIFDPKIITNSQGVIFNSIKGRNDKYMYQPEVWESILNIDNVGNETHEDILRGVGQATEYYNASLQTAEQYCRSNQKTLLRALKKPTRRMIEVLGSLQFDYGTVDEPICPLVNLTISKRKAYKWLLFNRSEFKSFYFHQGWKWGAASYYHFRIAYRLWRKLTDKPSF